MPGGHLCVDERTSSTAQPGKGCASCLPGHSNSTAWLHHPARFFNNYPIKFSQKSWCNLWWSVDLQRAHCKDCSILQVCITQHQKDQALTDRACSSTSCPGPCHFKTGLLQCSSSWTSIKHNQTFTDDSECSSTTGTGYQLQLASSLRHWCLHIEQPQAQHPLISTHWWSLRSTRFFICFYCWAIWQKKKHLDFLRTFDQFSTLTSQLENVTRTWFKLLFFINPLVKENDIISAPHMKLSSWCKC